MSRKPEVTTPGGIIPDPHNFKSGAPSLMRSSTRRHVTYVMGDDWEGIYVNGELAAEGHHLSPRDVLKAVLKEPFDVVYADIDWLEDRGNLPAQLKEVKGSG